MTDHTEIETGQWCGRQQIVMQQGANLVVAARGWTTRRPPPTPMPGAAIVKSLMEALSAPPSAMIGQMQAENESPKR